jgi:hypothetical protein
MNGSVAVKDVVEMAETAEAAYRANVLLKENVPGRAIGLIQHRRPTRWLDNETPDPDSYELVYEEVNHNQITNAGRDFMHLQAYSSVAAGGSAPGSSGLNFIGLTNTAITPAAGDTTLSGEIVANGLSRAQGTYAHTNGTNTTTVTKTFTCATSSQAAQAAALFSASSSGTMNHELTFTQRTLQVGDQLVVTFTITLG